jgi:hypothetical protein
MSGSKAEDFHEGETVLYVPRHAQGDITHPDCEHGVVSSQNGESVVRALLQERNVAARIAGYISN